MDDTGLEGIVGAEHQQCNTSCSSSGDGGCTEAAGLCGAHTITYSRTCCGCAESGSCSESSHIYKKTETCAEDPDTLDCVGEGDWETFTMQACG